MFKRLKVFFVALFLASLPIMATAEIIPAGCTYGSGDVSKCGLPELVQVFINIYNLGIRYVGAVSALFFIIGGFMLLISGGRSNLVDLGKKIIIGSVVGMFIVLTSFLIVRIAQTQLLDAEGQYLISEDEQCSGKKDGTRCYNNNVVKSTANKSFYGNYVCISGICSSTTKCVYDNQSETKEYTIGGQKVNLTRQCISRDNCDPGDTIQKNLCPGDANNVCCYPDPAKNYPTQ